MGDTNKSKKGFEISIWSVVVICITIVFVVAMLTGNLDKLIEYIKQIP